MKNIIATLSALFILTFFAKGQVISGQVYNLENNTWHPIARANVYILGISSGTTDDDGIYSLDISECTSCKPGTPLVISVNAPTGYTEVNYTVASNPTLHPFNIEIKENGKLSINGTIKDKSSGKFLENITVSVVITNNEKPLAIASTDRLGRFQLIIKRDGINKMNAITVLIKDESNKYNDLQQVVFINENEPLTLELSKCEDCGNSTSYKVNSNLKTDIYLKKGEHVKINATGKIRLGTYAGPSDPTGLSPQFSRFFTKFSYFPELNHGALLFRFSENEEWQSYDPTSEHKYTAENNGFLEFTINDMDRGNNSGFYQVDVTTH